MNKVVVTVVDSAKARFLILESAQFPEEAMGSRLVELDGLSNPLNQAQGQELWSSTKTGRNLGGGSQTRSQAHSYDDHRDSHRAEYQRRFTQAIATHLVNLVQHYQSQQVILIAESQLMNWLGEAIATSGLAQLNITPVTKQLSHLTPFELQKYLAHEGLLPESVRL